VKLLIAIAEDIGLSIDYIEKIALSASHLYKTYSVPKRTGGRRVIEHPSRELKLLQTWLSDNLFSKFPVSNVVFSYRIGKSIRDNASIHRQNNYLLKIDFRNYFPSIGASDIDRFLNDNQEYLPNKLSPHERGFVSDIVCRSGHLTIGAPSSPAISNAILYKFDVAISSVCKMNGVLYTRYADDLFFSTKVPNQLKIIQKEVRKALASIPYPRLKINEDKTVFTSRKRLRLVTGIVLTSDKRISVGRAKKREIKTMIYLFSKNALDDKKISYVRGTMAYVASIEPGFIASMEAKFGKRVLHRLWKAPIVNLKPKSRSAPGFEN
jgi:RNA-directed DNA polymerase